MTNQNCECNDCGIGGWTTDKLIGYARGYYDSIYKAECYGTKDLIMYSRICAELNRRGYEAEEKIEWVKQ